MRTLYHIYPCPRQLSNWSFHVRPSLMSQEFQSDEFFYLFSSRSTTNWVVELTLYSLKTMILFNIGICCSSFPLSTFTAFMILQGTSIDKPQSVTCIYSSSVNRNNSILVWFQFGLLINPNITKIVYNPGLRTLTCSSFVSKSGYGRKAGLLPTGKSSGT